MKSGVTFAFPNNKGRLAQLVQSTSFTPRGSGVRIPQRPQKTVKFGCLFLFMHFVYILFSQSANRYYIGETAHLEGRVEQHNQGYYAKASTKIAKDWVLFLSITCTDRTHALKIERFIKKQKSRKFIEKLKAEPSVTLSIVDKFK